MKNFLPLFLFLLLPFYNFAKNPLYFNDFSTQKDFPHTEISYFTQKQYHIFNPHTGDFYENPSFIPPKNHHIQVKIISSNLYNLEANEENIGGISFRGDKKNSLVVLLYPQKKQFAFLQYQSPQNNGQDNNNTEWTLITVKEDFNIHPHFNVLDIINLKDKITLFINGKKVYEGPNPKNKNILEQGYIGFYTSQNAHFHFENLRVWEANSNYLDNLGDFPPLNKENDLSQDFNNQYLESYGPLGKLITSHSFNNHSDSPFEKTPKAHPYLGKLEVFSPNKKLDLHAAKTIQVSNALIETSVKIEKPHKEDWVGIAFWGDTSYFFQINPVLKKVSLKKTITKKLDIPLYQKGEEIINPLQENILALEIYNNTLTFYINGKKIKTVTEEEDVASPSKFYGFTTLTKESPVLFNYIRVFEVQFSFLRFLKGNPIKTILFLVILIKILINIFLKLKQRKKLSSISRPQNRLERIEQELSERALFHIYKDMKITEKDLILEYQISKKEAYTVLEALTKNYQGLVILDVDEEGNFFVVFKDKTEEL